jgi:DNA-binding NarL/FixJ family response regulator
MILIADSRDFVYLLVQYLSKYHEFEIVGVAYDGKQAIDDSSNQT